MERQALEGVKVADFSWVIAGPSTTRYLAMYGAQVVKIESRARVDSIRTMAPFKDGKPGVNRSGLFAAFNSSKYSLGLNLNHPEAKQITTRLIEWADIVVENFTPGTMSKWGLGYDDLVKIKPDIIMASSSMHGQTGIYAGHPGLGALQVSLSGITNLTGYPNREPVQPYGVYPDFIVPPLLCTAITAALDYRRRTGKGQHLDISQNEATIYFISPVILDYTANGVIETRDGNRCPDAAPHGVYPCRGDDRWCAIAIFTDEEWQAFCRVSGNPELVKNSKFATLPQRKANEDELDALVAAWTVKHDPEEVMVLLQEANVAAGIVESAEELLGDPQLKYRNHYWTLNHPEMGLYRSAGLPYRMSKTEAVLRAAPCLGQDSEYVCTRILGFSDKEFLSLLEAGVIE